LALTDEQVAVLDNIVDWLCFYKPENGATAEVMRKFQNFIEETRQSN